MLAARLCAGAGLPGIGRDEGGEEAGEVADGAVGEAGEEWMDEGWVVGQTVDEVNRNALWETRRCAGWWRETVS